MSQVKPTIAAIAWFYPFNQNSVFMGTATPIDHTADALLCLLLLASPALPVGADSLVINKTDQAPLVGADLSVIERDAKKMRGDKPFVFTNLKTQEGLRAVLDFIGTNIC